MNCVFTAYARYLDYLSLGVSELEYAYYKCFKWATGDAHAFTYGGCVPHLVRTLAKRHGLEVVVQTSLLNKAYYVANVEKYERNLLKRHIVKHSDYGEDVPTITLEPAIYLPMPNFPHAFFSEYIPDISLTMALKLKRKTMDIDTFLALEKGDNKERLWVGIFERRVPTSSLSGSRIAFVFDENEWNRFTENETTAEELRIPFGATYVLIMKSRDTYEIAEALGYLTLQLQVE